MVRGGKILERIYVQPLPLKKLRRLIDAGIFAVPELQREFVWNRLLVRAFERQAGAGARLFER